MSIQIESIETRDDVKIDIDKTRSPEWISSESLAIGFREFNRWLDVPSEYQDAMDEVLEEQGHEISPLLPDHQRRVGGYAGVILPLIYPEYSDSFHVGLVRVGGALHDIGKYNIDRDVLCRSLGMDGFGPFNRGRDFPEVKKHTKYGYQTLTRMSGSVPPEARLIAFLHHRFPSEGHEGYGLEVNEIDNIFPNNKEMARWVKCSAKIVALADYYDATSRTNSYFKSEEERDTTLIRYMRYHQPDNYAEILEALRIEKLNYIVSTGKIALAA